MIKEDEGFLVKGVGYSKGESRAIFVFELTIMVFWTSALRFMSRFVFCLLTIIRSSRTGV